VHLRPHEDLQGSAPELKLVYLAAGQTAPDLGDRDAARAQLREILLQVGVFDERRLDARDACALPLGVEGARGRLLLRARRAARHGGERDECDGEQRRQERWRSRP
jgi:hypothetical protein